MKIISDTNRDKAELKELLTKENTIDNKLRAFNLAANINYLENTKKTCEELEEYLNYEQYSWGDNCLGDEWETVQEAIEVGELTADYLLEREEAGE